MSGGQIAALIAAGAFLLLVLLLAVPIIKLGRTVDATTRAVNQVADRVDPILADTHNTVLQLNASLAGVNQQLEKVDTLTDHVSSITGNVSAVTSLVSAAVASPLVKAASFAYGLRKAVKGRRKSDEDKAVRAKVKAARGGKG